jgi:hypothetical protein
MTSLKNPNFRNALENQKSCLSSQQKCKEETLDRRCPTLLPLATCGDRRFKCGYRQFFRNGLLMTNSLCFSQIVTGICYYKCGYKENLVGHHCFGPIVEQTQTYFVSASNLLRIKGEQIKITFLRFYVNISRRDRFWV